MLKKYPKEVKQYAEEIKFCETQIAYFESKRLAAEEAMNALLTKLELKSPFEWHQEMENLMQEMRTVKTKHRIDIGNLSECNILLPYYFAEFKVLGIRNMQRIDGLGADDLAIGLSDDPLTLDFLEWKGTSRGFRHGSLGTRTYEKPLFEAIFENTMRLRYHLITKTVDGLKIKIADNTKPKTLTDLKWKFPWNKPKLK